MSKYTNLVSNNDLLVLKDLANHTIEILNSNISSLQFKLNEVLDAIAITIDYPSWEVLSEFSEKQVMFTDIFHLIKEHFPSCILKLIPSEVKLTREHVVNISKKILSSFFPKNASWISTWNLDEQSEIKLCLLPTDVGNIYEVVGYKHELDLLIALEQRDALGVSIGPCIEINKEDVDRRHRPYMPSLPLYNYIEHYAKEAIFVENDNFLVSHFNYIHDSRLRLDSEAIQLILMRASFMCPRSYEFYYEYDKGELAFYFGGYHSYECIGRKKIAKEEKKGIKAHREGEAFQIEHLFMHRSLLETLQIDLSNPYRHFCKVQVCQMYSTPPCDLKKKLFINGKELLSIVQQLNLPYRLCSLNRKT
ncbi:hypothetical protein [Shewanella sp. ENK2]|uniref:hypothetical protein n=1 Tax=Shewanella sp. ENK2 TaxID=2775245 RepID=UPI0037480695